MTDEERIRLTLELEPTGADRRFRATVREKEGSAMIVFESALDLVGWLEARSGNRDPPGLR